MPPTSFARGDGYWWTDGVRGPAWDLSLSVRPSGPNFYRYEDTYFMGDSLQETINRGAVEHPGKIITFPEGRFTFTNFATNIGPGFWAGLFLPPTLGGIWGSGSGARGEESGTIFSMVPFSSTRAADMPPQETEKSLNIVMITQNYAVQDVSFGQFRLDCTDQGHIFSGLTNYNCSGHVEFTDLIVNGWRGNSGAPPGEAGALGVTGPTGGVDYLRCHVDGRLDKGTVAMGSLGFANNSVPHGTLTDCSSMYNQYSSIAMWQCKDMTTYNFVAGDRDMPWDVVGVDNRRLSHTMNHERTDNIVHYNPQIWKNQTSWAVHITTSNDNAIQTMRDGSRLDCNDGHLTIHNPQYSDIHGNGRLYIQSWNPYISGSTMVTPPTVTGLAPGLLMYQRGSGWTRI